MSELFFDGFEPANTTPVPDVLFDVLLPHLNEAQLKVMLYIIRRTLGFKKSADAISLSQFRHGITTRDGRKLDEGCGLKNFTTITKALDSLEQMHCIERDRQKTAAGDKATTVYRIKFRGTTPTVVPTTSNGGRVLRKTEDGTTRNGGRVLRETEIQETVIQETDKQETGKQEKESVSPSSDSPLPSSSQPLTQEKEESLPVSTYNDETICETFYQLQGFRPRLKEQLAKERKLAAEIAQTTSQEELMTAYSRMKADPYWKTKQFSLATFAKHLPEYLHTPEKQTPLQGEQVATMSETTKRNIERLKAAVAQKGK